MQPMTLLEYQGNVYGTANAETTKVLAGTVNNCQALFGCAQAGETNSMGPYLPFTRVPVDFLQEPHSEIGRTFVVWLVA